VAHLQLLADLRAEGVADRGLLRRSLTRSGTLPERRTLAVKDQPLREGPPPGCTWRRVRAALRSSAANGADAPSQSVGSQQRAASPALGGSAVSGSVSRSDIFHQTEQQIIELRERAAAEKHPDKLRVDRRALTGVFIGAGEFGDESLAARDYALAKDYFQLASDAYPDSVGALKELAQARALDNDRKGALETLRRAKEKSKDLAAFTAWLNQEPAFAKLREDPQFRALLANP